MLKQWSLVDINTLGGRNLTLLFYIKTVPLLDCMSKRYAE
jgi:hypothetical protein